MVYQKVFSILFISLGMAALPSQVQAGAQDQAIRMYSRLAGGYPSQATLQAMIADIQSGNPAGAALIAMNQDSFYNTNLKNWFAPWSNVNGSALVDLNDFTATAIGMVRDGIPFSQALNGDIIYTAANESVYDKNTNPSGVHTYGFTLPDNQHYLDIQSKNLNLRNVLVKGTQSSMPNSAGSDAAGLLTTKAFASAYFSQGTNRRALRYAFKNFLCMDIPLLSDTTRSDYHVRQDVTRSPAGDSRTYINTCKGCHAGMDALDGAFAYYDFATDNNTGNLIFYNPGKVNDKMVKNSQNYPNGYVTKDDSFVNLWTAGPNAGLGWGSTTSGNGAKALGTMISEAQAFPQCMATRVFNRVCLHDPQSSAEISAVSQMSKDFVNNKFNMQTLFEEAAVQCMGE